VFKKKLKIVTSLKACRCDCISLTLCGLVCGDINNSNVSSFCIFSFAILCIITYFVYSLSFSVFLYCEFVVCFLFWWPALMGFDLYWFIASHCNHSVHWQMNFFGSLVRSRTFHAKRLLNIFV